VLTTLLIISGLIVTALIVRGERRVRSTNPLHGRPDMVHRLAMFDSGPEFVDGKLEHARVVMNGNPHRIVLDDKRDNTYPRYGYWTSPEVPTPFAFTEVVPSWNATTPPDTGVRFQVRVRDARSGAWSPWLYVGQWGRTIIPRAQDRPVVTFARGIVNVDNLVLDRPANAYQVRACLQSFDFDRSVNPSIRRISIAYSGIVHDDQHRARLIEPVEVKENWARDLPVPFRAQGDTPPPLRGQSCSPTSVSMVLAYWGIDRPTRENAAAIYDNEHDLFGNWNRAVQCAAAQGLDGYVTRLHSWDQVKAFIAAGQPLIASINFDRREEFPSALYDDTNGHLIVIRGLAKDGDAIVNDPANREKGNGVIYKADELSRAWFTNAGGVTYIITGKRPPDPSSAIAPATRPAAPATASSDARSESAKTWMSGAQLF
jgi:hypothetical protein